MDRHIVEDGVGAKRLFEKHGGIYSGPWAHGW
jgi:hypothetical protein